jgi:hypothetical protein
VSPNSNLIPADFSFFHGSSDDDNCNKECSCHFSEETNDTPVVKTEQVKKISISDSMRIEMVPDSFVHISPFV